MDTVGDLAESLGVTVEKFKEDVEPGLRVCIHAATCSFGYCEHIWPHHPSSEIGTCDYEACINMGVIACCTPVEGEESSE